MARHRDLLVGALVVGVTVETAIAVVLRAPGAGRAADGTPTPPDLLAVIGLLWLPLLGALTWYLVRHVSRLDQGLDDREAALASLAATSDDWLWEADADLRVTSASPACTTLLGREPDRLVGRCMIDLVHPEDQVRMRAALATALREGRGWSELSVRWPHATGDVAELQGSASPLLTPGGLVRGFRGSWRAVSAQSAARQRLYGVAHRVSDVITSGSLRTALQPIVDLTTGRWLGVEALARFPDNADPDRWFAEAHDAGHGVALELAAVRAALRTLADLPDPVYLSVNVSPAVLLDPGFGEIMRVPGLPLDRLVVEITEHTAVSRYDDIRAVLLPLRERGLRLAVDDAGAGYASFNHVLKLRPDIIKLDRSLVSGIDTDSARRALVTAVVMLALDTGAQVTAEGVETAAELDVLLCLGVDTAQGFLFARPSLDRALLQGWATRDWLGHAGTAGRAGRAGHAGRAPDRVPALGA